jgi:hypothetical protein
MANSAAAASGTVKGIRFAGHSTGAVKTLPGFRKGQHTVPDSVNQTTTAFLARLCAGQLGEEAEAFFQRARAACGYKRKDISLTVSSPQAILTAKDFSLEILYSFDGDDAATYRSQWTLSSLSELAFIQGEACGEVFGGSFDELVFSLTKGARVESVIDAVEGLPAGGLRVAYPSDCQHCMLTVEGVEASLRFDGAELAMVFPRSGSPAELLEGFLAVRQAFSLCEDKALSVMLV